MFVGIAIGFNFWLMGLPIIFLNAGLIISLFVWTNFNRSYSRNLSWLYLIGTLIQVTHFFEEYYTEFYKTLPSIFNAYPWTKKQFIIFNIIWLIVFLSAAIGTFKNNKLSFLIMWFFLIIGCIGNGILHIGLSLLQQKYFPGAVTAAFLFIIGIIMTREVTRSFKINSNRSWRQSSNAIGLALWRPDVVSFGSSSLFNLVPA